MTARDIKKKVFLKIKEATIGLDETLIVPTGVSQSFDTIIARVQKAPAVVSKRYSDEEIAEGLFHYLKKHRKFTHDAKITALTPGDVTSIATAIEEAKTLSKRQTKAKAAPESDGRSTPSDTSEVSTTAASFSPRTPVTEEDVKKLFRPDMAIAAEAYRIAKDRADTLREIQFQETLREGAENIIRTKIALLREKEFQIYTKIDKIAEKIHKRQKAGQSVTSEELSSELKGALEAGDTNHEETHRVAPEALKDIRERLIQQAKDDGLLVEDLKQAEQQIITETVAEMKAQGMHQNTIITVPNTIPQNYADAIAKLHKAAEEEKRHAESVYKDQEKRHRAEYEIRLAETIAKRAKKALEKAARNDEERRAIDTLTHIGTRGEQELGNMILEFQTYTKDLIEREAIGRTEQDIRRSMLSNLHTLERADAEASETKDRESVTQKERESHSALEAMHAQTQQMLDEQQSRSAAEAVKAKQRKAAALLSDVLQGRHNDRANATERFLALQQQKGKEAMPQVEEQLNHELKQTVSTGSTWGFGGYKAKRDQAIAAISHSFCTSLSEDRQAMAVLGAAQDNPVLTSAVATDEVIHKDEGGAKLSIGQETTNLARHNARVMAPVVHEFCVEHKGEETQEFTRSVERWAPNAAAPFVTDSAKLMSLRGEETMKRMFPSQETASPDTTPRSSRGGPQQQQK